MLVLIIYFFHVFKITYYNETQVSLVFIEMHDT
jgi:hypothetical protein